MDNDLKQYLDTKFADMDAKYATKQYLDQKFADIDAKFAALDTKFATKRISKHWRSG